ncbi:MAG: FAD-dependent oxidoreductase [Planctomycetota bacterium]
MLSWLIVGGGLHGTHLSLVLTKALGASRVKVLDAEEEPLGRWMHQTRNTGMTHLRSPIGHHLDLQASSLRDFSRKWREPRRCITPLARPSLSMFNAHSLQVIERNRLAELRLQGMAQAIDVDRNHVRVETDAGELRAKRVILALGSASPCVPPWAEALSKAGAAVHHLFAMDFQRLEIETSGTTVVVGGGISGAQLASRLVEQGAQQVVVIARDRPRVRQFDSDLVWLEGRHMNRLARLEPAARRPVITAARHKGSMPSEVNERLRGHLDEGVIAWHEGSVLETRITTGQRIEVSTQDEVLAADRLVLATGFEPSPPGNDLLQRLGERASLPISPCGFPVADRFLRWHPRVFVTGALGELTLGPTARNIVGARRAGSLIKQLAKRS